MSDETPVCVEVIRAIGKVEGTDPTNIEFELHDHIHTDALEFLASDERGPWELNFEVPGHEITVRSDRTILVDDQVVRGGS